MSRLYCKQSKIDGNGLFTSEALKAGQHVGYIQGPIEIVRNFSPKLSEESMDWIGVGKYSWINTKESPFRCINHSCEPNVAHVTKRKIIALIDLPADSELTMDYSLTEADTDWEIKPCKCGSKICRKVITSIEKLPERIVKVNELVIPQAFLKIYKNHNKH